MPNWMFSVDTGVLVLLVGSYKLGRQRAEALIGWYAFKGTDNAGSFACKGVTTQFKAFMQCDGEILDAFAVFGMTQKILECIFRQMERYICMLYSTGNIKTNTVAELRWILLSMKKAYF